MRKIFLLLLLTLTTLFASQIGVVSGLDPYGDGFLSLRVKPKSKEIGKLYNGNALEILDKSGKYYKVKDIQSNKIGWAHGNWIKINTGSFNADDFFNLGSAYDDNPAKQDLVKAAVYYEKACDGGNSHGCYRLGEMYNNGEGVKQDDTEAVKFYGKACDKQHRESCYLLALKYDRGQGVKQDDTKTVELLDKACHNYDSRGCLRLAIMYDMGVGVKKDELKAKKFFNKVYFGPDYVEETK